jgi:uncharacterized membrane protein YfcA
LTETLRAFDLPSDVLLWQAAALTVLSYAVGVLGGFVGLALGTVRLPVMLLLGLPVVTAGGTNILVSTLSAAAGSVTHLRERRVDRDLVLWMGVPSAFGGLAGGLLAGLAHQGVLLSIVGAFVLWQSLEFFLLARRSEIVDRGRGLGRGRRLAEALIGFVIGVLGGAVGLILGSVRLPALVRVLGIEPRVAAGTNLVIGMLIGVAGWIGHVAIGAVDYPLLVLMAVAGMAGQIVGAGWTGRAPREVLLATMAVVLALIGALLLRDGIARLLA